MSEPYRHTQIGWTLILILLIALLGELTAVAFVAPGATFALMLSGALAAMLAVMLVLFATLTVVVDDVAVRLSFGAGVLKRNVALDDIVAARRVRNHWWTGWGVRVLPNGRLYNVGGLDAVELELDLDRVVRVGTDDPDALLAAVKKRRLLKEG
jgi:hypothetical protein